MANTTPQSLEGRSALVTGASRGIGRVIAQRLAADGARLLVTARSADALKQVVAELPGEGHQRIALDLADRAALPTTLAQIAADFGQIDILVNNAGVAESKPYHETDDALWERMMDINAMSVFRLCRALIPKMVSAGWGRVIITASNAGLIGYPYSSAYCASKHAVLGFMRAVALEIARGPVTINAVCPGWVATDMAEEAVQNIARKTGKSPEEARKNLLSMSPQRRMVEPEEVAAVVSMLCGNEARSMHGQALVIDGGQVMR